MEERQNRHIVSVVVKLNTRIPEVPKNKDPVIGRVLYCLAQLNIHRPNQQLRHQPVEK